ncbi:iron ABC transporter permease [Alphaproteobacteria bacterium]|jgi:iron(III) transport system permease protein|nr:iron ABC transporter permease [Alphaproteobacteria bacterium]
MVATFLSNFARAQRQPVDRWSVGVILLCSLILGPVLAVLVAAFGDSGGLWSHLYDTVLGRYISNTLILMAGVGVVAIGFGVSSAWVINRYDFAGRRILEWMLLLPAAIPAYIIAYSYTEFFEYAGPLQSGLRHLFGWQSPRDYWFPEIRSLGGAILVMASVLYPYIYMVTRIAFRLTPASLFEIALVHNRSQFWQVGLPLARPAIMAGLALVMMEVMSDFGTVEFFAIETITLGIFNVWLGMNNLVAAAQISIVGFGFIVALLGLELYARSRQQYVSSSRNQTPLAMLVPTKAGIMACWAVCIIPLLFGFFIPVGVLLGLVATNDLLADFMAIQGIIGNTLIVAAIAAVVIMVLSAFIVVTATFRAGSKTRKLALFASTGYAFPGTILAIGVLIFTGQLDRAIAAVFGAQFQGILITSIGVLFLAYIVRFQAVGYGAMISGVRRLPANMMNASRVLGQGYMDSIRRVIMPLLKSSFLAGMMLVFVDVMKELPMTLLLRPFNFDTLATYTYQFAKDEMLEVAALPALMIVLSGLVPVILMSAMLRRYR